MLEDREVLMLWRKLFRGQAITMETMERAESLLNELGQESPLRIRLAQELKDIERLHSPS